MHASTVTPIPAMTAYVPTVPSSDCTRSNAPATPLDDDSPASVDGDGVIDSSASGVGWMNFVGDGDADEPMDAELVGDGVPDRVAVRLAGDAEFDRLIDGVLDADRVMLFDRVTVKNLDGDLVLLGVRDALRVTSNRRRAPPIRILLNDSSPESNSSTSFPGPRLYPAMLGSVGSPEIVDQAAAAGVARPISYHSTS